MIYSLSRLICPVLLYLFENNDVQTKSKQRAFSALASWCMLTGFKEYFNFILLFCYFIYCFCNGGKSCSNGVVYKMWETIKHYFFDQLNKFNLNLFLELVFGIKIKSAVFQYCYIFVWFSLSVTVEKVKTSEAVQSAKQSETETAVELKTFQSILSWTMVRLYC